MTLNVTTAAARAARTQAKAAAGKAPAGKAPGGKGPVRGEAPDDYWATIVPGEKWRKRAACRHTEPELFFPVSAAGQAERAKKICAGCPVRRECLQFALATRQSDGVWGGLELTGTDRRKPVRA
jgi:WhiB family redox-sensing transcriptional regulator